MISWIYFPDMYIWQLASFELTSVLMMVSRRNNTFFFFWCHPITNFFI